MSAGKISEKAEDDVKEKGIIRSGKGEKCRESDAGIDSLHFQCYNGKQPGGVNI